MSIAFIYSHDERQRVDIVARDLENHGYEVTLAPLGREVGTPEWFDCVRVDIERSQAVLVFITRCSVQDDWVLHRVKLAINSGKQLLPLKMDDVDLGPNLNLLIGRYQMLTCLSELDFQRTLTFLTKSLPKPPVRVECFLSYSRDDTDFVQKLKTDLEEHGIDCWRDLDDIPAGASWDREIETALSKCSHILLVVSGRSVQSANVADELSFARERKKPIIPLLLDDAPLPLRVHRAQAIDFRTDYRDALKHLVNNLGVGE